MSATDTEKRSSLKEADIDSTVLFRSVWKNLYLVVGFGTLIGLIVCGLCYWLFPDSFVMPPEGTDLTDRVLSFKMITASFFSGILLSSIIIVVSDIRTGRALIAPYQETKTIFDDDLNKTSKSKSLIEDKIMHENGSEHQLNNSDHVLTNLSDSNHTDVSTKEFARSLHHLDVSRIVAISPEDDDGAAVTLELVRELADRGSRVILVDMTGTGAVSAIMLGGNYEAGLTDLLVGQVRFADAIHADHYSEAHVMPLGLCEPSDAMKNENDLSLIIGALETVYDLVVLECGPSWAADMKPLVTHNTQIALTIYDRANPDIDKHVQDLNQNDYSSFICLHPSETVAPSTI
ncbi:tyrosine-protein kinase family protein [Brucellaceae bacterium C25G]